MTRLAVLFGGPSPEHDVSILTGLQAAQELLRSGESVEAIYWNKDGRFLLVDPSSEGEAYTDGAPKGAESLSFSLGPDGGFLRSGRFGRSQALELDAVVLATHGGQGEDGSLQGALDLAGIPYTGPSVAGAALGMDKLSFAAVVERAGLPSLPRRALNSDLHELDFCGPYIVKPRFGGSSIGIDVVEDLATAKARLAVNPHLRAGAIIEPYRPDLHDLQVAVRRYPSPQHSAIERPLHSGAGILAYADKYIGGQGMVAAPRELPAQISAKLSALVSESALALLEACLLRGVARIDFLANEEMVYPGSLARYLWVDPPVSFAQLLADMVAEAISEPTALTISAGADGSVLRSAGSIASKLA
ncbi:MAG: hypothetical protein NT160_08160 [Actinobacteria bacterium]|nr:hypothetical protein [Actinomycetota bacterium]